MEMIPTSEYANIQRPSLISLDKDSCKKRRFERMEVMKRKRQRSDSICGDTLSSISYTSTASVSTISTVSSIFLTKDELRRKKNRESAERSRLRKLRLIDNLASSQVTTLREKQIFLKRENASLRAASVAPPTTAPSRARSARIILCTPEVVDDKAKYYLDDSSDASSLSSSSNSPYRAASFPALTRGVSSHCLPSTAFRIKSDLAHGYDDTDDQIYALYSSSEEGSPLAAPAVEYSFEELFDFTELCDFDLYDL